MFFRVAVCSLAEKSFCRQMGGAGQTGRTTRKNQDEEKPGRGDYSADFSVQLTDFN